MTNKKREAYHLRKGSAEFPLKLPSGEVIERDRRQSGVASRQPICSGISSEALEPILAKCEVINLSPGDVLLSPEDENHYLYLVLGGRLKTHIHAIDSDEGFIVGEGECVGEISVTDGMLPSAFVVAESPARVLAIHENILWSDFFKVPGMARNFMQQLTDRMRNRSNAMQQALEHKLRLEHLERELSIAHDIQAQMLPQQEPRFPDHPRIDACAMMLPAKEVGGDFYDAFVLDKQRVCVAIGDVSGKGVPAALFMVRAMTLLRSEMMKGHDLGEVMQNLNNTLCADNVTFMFVTLLIVVVDTAKGEYTLVNGGHNRPLLAHGGKDYQYLELPDGIVAGVMENANYETATGKLERNDMLVLYTDGVTEARNKQREFYTEERLGKSLEQAETESANDVVAHILKDVNTFASGAPQSDDITLVVVRYPGTSG